MFDFIVHHLEQMNQIAEFLIALLTIAEWIYKLRKEKMGCTQEEFAELFGVAPRTVQRWEQGKREPRREHLLMMQKLDDKVEGATLTDLWNALQEAGK